MLLSDNRPIKNKKRYDVIVVGGGVAGVSAAVSAARNGASTLLVEKQINLGGLANMAMKTFLLNGAAKEKIQAIMTDMLPTILQRYFHLHLMNS